MQYMVEVVLGVNKASERKFRDLIWLIYNQRNNKLPSFPPKYGIEKKIKHHQPKGGFSNFPSQIQPASPSITLTKEIEKEEVEIMYRFKAILPVSHVVKKDYTSLLAPLLD